MNLKRVIQFLLFLIVPSCLLTASAQDTDATSTGKEQKETESSPAGDDIRARLAPPNPFPRTTALDPKIFELGNGWLNTDQPITLKDLKGKVVLLDFWTYCCINCMHVLPDLKYLERKYENQLVVIGVHSAKFDNEKDKSQIAAAVHRYEIDHPVINDPEMLIWNRFGVRAWPTLALIDPEGRLVGIQPGEGNRILFDRIIEKMVRYHRWKGTLNEKPLRFLKERVQPDLTKLHYPGKVCVDQQANRLFISDSSHHRIVVCDLDGKFQFTIGSADQGLKDGDFQTAQFNRPQGMLVKDDVLYVADTDNHAIRAVDIEKRTVRTVVGDGKQAGFGAVGGSIPGSRLNSPWDIALWESDLYIAMAGSHQIWRHQIGSEQIEVFAGNGREDVLNGNTESAAFAQPSDLAFTPDGSRLYVVDSEGSAIRRIDMETGFVSTTAGTSGLPRGQSLFAFGDVDGVGSDVRFQHPLAVATISEGLLVADSYNHKVRKVALPLAETSTWLGQSEAGDSLNPLRLAEPGDIATTKEFAWIADTNNHRILKVNLATRSVVQLPVSISTTLAAAGDGEPDRDDESDETSPGEPAAESESDKSESTPDRSVEADRPS